METTLINSKKRVPDKGCTFNAESTGKSRLISLMVSMFIICLSDMSAWAQQIEPNILDGRNNDSAWNVQNILSFSAHSYVQDRSGQGQIDDGYNGGSKDILNNGWIDGMTKTKNDISNAAAILTNNRLYFAGDRDGTNGDSMIACWFFLNGTKPVVEFTSPNIGGTLLPLHAVGDILIVSNFTAGGTVSNVEVYEWVGSGGDFPTSGPEKGVFLIKSTSAGQATLSPAGGVSRPVGWKNENVPYLENQFFEGFINLANLNLPSLCFSSFLLETRSSQSVTAQLDDFAAGNFTAVPLIEGIVTNVNCFGGSTGAIDITVSGGTSPYTFDWSDLSHPPAEPEDRTGLAANTYTVQVTDNNGCLSAIKEFVVTQSPTLTCNAVPTNPQCNSANGGQGGSITVTPTGGTSPYQYKLNDGSYQSSNVFSGLANATYTITVKDAHDCTSPCEATILAPPALTCEAVPTNAQCNSSNGGQGGSITITPTGGTSPYKYKLNDGSYQDSNVFPGLADATYTITVKDAHDCTSTCQATILAASSLTCNAVPTNANCNSANEGQGGSIAVTPTGGTSPYKYKLNDGSYQDSNVFSGLADATYTITVKDAHDCTSTCQATILAPPELILLADKIDPDCYNEKGSITFSASGGTGTITFTVNGNAAVSPLSNLLAGPYIIIATDSKGCTDTETRTIIIPGGSDIAVQCADPGVYDVICTSSVETNQADLIDAYNDWVDSFSFTGGFNPPISGKEPIVEKTFFDLVDNGNGLEEVASTNIPPALSGGVKVVYYTVHDDCSSDNCRQIFTVSNPCQPNCGHEVQDYFCFGEKGVFSVSAVNGLIPYTLHVYQVVNGQDIELAGSPYTISDASFSKDFDLLAGDYKATINDAQNLPGETCIETATIHGPLTELNLSLVSKTDQGCNGIQGTIAVEVSGGTAPYQVQLDSGALINLTVAPYTHTFDVNSGSYIVHVFDAGYHDDVDATKDHIVGCTKDLPVEIGSTPCAAALCTYTQGFYQSTGMGCDTETPMRALALIQKALDNAGGSITIGFTPNTLLLNNATCINQRMPGGGPAKELPAGSSSICSLPASLLKNGKINNVLVGQTIALNLNAGYQPLGDLALQAGTLYTAKPVGGCGSDVAKERICNYNLLAPYNLLSVTNEYKSRTFSAALIAALPTKDVKGLILLCNYALGNKDGVTGSENGVSLSEIAGAAGSINEVFDECAILVGWNVAPCPSIDPTPGQARMSATNDTSAANLVIAYPNPFKDHLTFELKADVSANASLQVFNILGQRVSDVFNGYLEAGTVRTVDFNTPYNMNESMLIYVYRLGDHTYTGRLIVKP